MINKVEANGNKYTKRVLLLILFFSILKFFIAGNIDLGTDESYYWLYAQKLQINYFDHPPMVAYWLRFFTGNLLLQQYEVFVRLGSIVACGFSTWFMYKTVAEVHSQRAGWIAACLYNASLYATVTAGLLAMPDAPQMFFYTLSLWMLVKIYSNEKAIYPWILFGIASGLCIISKAHGIFLWVGVGTYVLFCKRNWLGYYQLYLAALIAIIIASPIVFWNIANDFVTYKFHTNRVVIQETGVNWMGFVRELIGEIIINNPFNIVLILLALFIKNKLVSIKQSPILIFNYIGLTLLFTIFFIALFRETLPHWSGVAYVALIPIAAIKFDSLTNKKLRLLPALSMTFCVLVLLSIYSFINFYPGNFAKGNKENYGHADLSVDNYGWSMAAPVINIICQDEIKRSNWSSNTPFVCNKWWGAHIDYYVCVPNGIQMIGLGEVNELHQYTWLNSIRKNSVDLSNAFCVVPSIDNYDVQESYKNYYSKIEYLTTVNVVRQGKPAYYFFIYKLSGWKNNLPEIK
ncbi:MAG: glycosyltransferase family 39 protein [Bacteroidota bacterium]